MVKLTLCDSYCIQNQSSVRLDQCTILCTVHFLRINCILLSHTQFPSKPVQLSVRQEETGKPCSIGLQIFMKFNVSGKT